MGERGAAPRPTAVKKLHGTYRPDRSSPKETAPRRAIGEQLKPSDWLSQGAREKWEELAPRLHSLGLLTEIDLDVLALYCTAWSNWRGAEEAVRKRGATTKAQRGYEAVSPYVTRAKNPLAELIKLGNLLRLSPSARSGVEAAPQGEGKDELLA